MIKNKDVTQACGAECGAEFGIECGAECGTQNLKALGLFCIRYIFKLKEQVIPTKLLANILSWQDEEDFRPGCGCGWMVKGPTFCGQQTWVRYLSLGVLSHL